MKARSLSRYLASAITAFWFTPMAQPQTYTQLTAFQCQPINHNLPVTACDPNDPGMLAQGEDGNLYGTLFLQETGGHGNIFEYSLSSNVFSVLKTFANTEELNPRSGLTLGVDGNFYGAAINGGTPGSGSSGYGNIFQFTSSGGFSIVHAFVNDSQGAYPLAPPILGRDGFLYGPTLNGTYPGTAYRASTSTTTPKIADLPSVSSAPFIWGPDGNLYGTTQQGGAYNQGTVFRLTPDGVKKIIYSFNPSNPNEGAVPKGPLLLGIDGNFYGTTSSGSLGSGNVGVADRGVVYKVTPNGVYTTLHAFADNGSEGTAPVGGLVQGSDFFLYGVTPTGGGTGHSGTLFKVDPFGSTFSVLHSFAQYTSMNAGDGSAPYATPFLHTNSVIYGLASAGGSYNYGALYKFENNLNPFISVVGPPEGQVGLTINILGQGFLGATAVKFGSVSAQFKVFSDTFMTATVPAGATTSRISVVETTGNLSTLAPFYVVPNPPVPSGFVPITPCRLLDTRTYMFGRPLWPNTTFTLNVPGSCGVPSTAAAYVLNVTVVPMHQLGSLSVFPAGQPVPTTSTLN